MAAPRRRPVPRPTQRDHAILAWGLRSGPFTVAQLAEAFMARADGTVGLRAAYRRAQILEDRGLLRRTPTYWCGPHVRTVTSAGARLVGSGLRPARIVWTQLIHDLAVTDLTRGLLRAYPGASLQTEREITTERRRATSARTRGMGLGRIPDAVLTLPTGERIAIELELSDKGAQRRRSMLDAYARGKVLDGLDRVWWFVRPAFERAMRAAIATARSDDWMEVRAWTGSWKSL